MRQTASPRKGRSSANLARDGPALTRPTGRPRLRRWVRPGTSTGSPWGKVSRSTRWPRRTRARTIASTASGVPRTSKNGWGARKRMRSRLPSGSGAPAVSDMPSANEGGGTPRWVRAPRAPGVTGGVAPEPDRRVPGPVGHSLVTQKPFRVHGRHAAAPGGGDGLPIAVVLDVARRENTGHARGRGAVAGQE